MKRDYWLTFYRPLTGPSIAVDFVRAAFNAELTEPTTTPLGAQYVIRHVFIHNVTFEEMQSIKLGAKYALEVARGL